MSRRPTMHLRVDPIACTGHGMCAELFPELIELDDWGYPIVRNDGVVPRELEDHAIRAAQVCPTLAVLIDRQHVPAAGHRKVQPAAPRRVAPSTRSGQRRH